jgi:dTDP-4-amino-4,6-dideoxygalactose transaminase
LQQKGISTRPGTHAIHLLGYYQNRFSFKPEDYPKARDCDRFSMAIPLHNQMQPEDYQYTVQILKTI